MSAPVKGAKAELQMASPRYGFLADGLNRGKDRADAVGRARDRAIDVPAYRP
jgi:hypothetical protein